MNNHRFRAERLFLPSFLDSLTLSVVLGLYIAIRQPTGADSNWLAHSDA